MHVRNLLEKKSSSNVSEATVQLLRSLKVPVTATTAIEQVESHPDFPSLYSISDSLKSWKVENGAFKVEPEKLDDLPKPFIAHTHKDGGTFVLVKNVNGTVDFINEKGREEKQDRETFLKDWTSNVLLAEKNEDSGEKDFAKRKKAERLTGLRIPLLVGAGLLLVGLFAILNSGTTIGVAASILLLVKLAGCTVTGLLLWFEVDKANPVLQQICSGSKNTNCTAVLSSKSSKLFTWLSWSEVGFFYFTGTFLCLSLTSTSAFPLLAWLNLLALPYTVFSVYYQWRVAKQWCPLCLAVQALLIIEATTFLVGFWNSDLNQPFIASANQLIVLTSFSLPVLFWLVSKKVFVSAKEGKEHKRELAKLKYNKEIFTSLLQKQKTVTASTDGLGITLGNSDAAHTLIKVCNPYCDPCAQAHRVIDELLESSDVKVQIIFTATNDEKDTKAPPIKHLMAIYAKGNIHLTERALDDWYNSDNKDYNAFAAKYHLSKDDLGVQGRELEAMDTWCKATGISFTPTVFVDGYQLPEMYRIEELKHLL